MEAHSGGGMKSGQHEPIGGGEAVDRFLNINFSLLNREKRVRSWLDSYLKYVSSSGHCGPILFFCSDRIMSCIIYILKNIVCVRDLDMVKGTLF